MTSVSAELEERWLLDRVAEGLSVEQIEAQTSGVTVADVRRKLRRHRIADPNGSRPASTR